MSETRPLWSEGSESGRQVVVLGLAGALTVVAVDYVLVGEMSLFFDLCFVTLCLGLAVVASRDAFFTVCLLPPVLMLAVFLLLAVVAPGAVARPQDGVVQAVVAGLAHHSEALVAGYAVALGTLEHRRRQAPGTQPSNLEGSPAPTRTTSG